MIISEKDEPKAFVISLMAVFQCPQMDVVYPLAQSVLINEIDDEMKLMYANLFVNASSKETSRFVHPSFASIINQLTVDEIKLFKQFENSPSKAWPIVNIMDRNVTILTNYTNIGSGVLKEEKNICAYIDNLSRLNLILIEPGVCLADENRYKPLKELNPVVSELISNHIYKHTQLKYEHRTIRLTNLGRMFKRACFNQEEI